MRRGKNPLLPFGFVGSNPGSVPFHHCTPRKQEVDVAFSYLEKKVRKLEKELNELRSIIRTYFIIHILPEQKERLKTRKLELDD